MSTVKFLIIPLIVTFLFTSCQDNPSGVSGSDKFKGVPSGEIVPVEQRDLVLTGIGSANKNKESADSQSGQKWWKQIISKLTYKGCPGYEDEDTTLENTFFGFKPNGTLAFKIGRNGQEVNSTSWEWVDENKTAIHIEMFGDIEYELRALNDDEVVYASLQPQEGGCEVVTWEQFGESHSE